MRRSTSLLVAALLTLPAAASAQGADRVAVAGSFGAAGTVGTLGIGGSVIYQLTPNLNVRGNFTTILRDVTKGVHEVDFDLDFPSVFRVTGDYYVGANFYLSGGFLAVTDDVFGTGVLLNPKDFGGTEYRPADVGTLSAVFEVSQVQPYLGFGWGNPIGPMAAVQLDVGMGIGSEPDVQLTTNGRLAEDADFLVNVDLEEQEFADDISDFIRLFPVLSVSVSLSVGSIAGG